MIADPVALHVHLEPVGGLAGDMFCAAMLDAFPDAWEAMQADLKAAGVLDHVLVERHHERVNGMKALSFQVSNRSANPRPTGHYSHIRAKFLAADLPEPVRVHTLGIFDLLAAAEAAVHDVAVEQVHFHEVADWDSQADIVAAASLIHHSGVQSWSCGGLPMGGGLVKTEHGLLPVPAPATAQLLQGFDWIDDGETGERITPTGAAILRYLMTTNRASKPAGSLRQNGSGCGRKRFATLPNLLRLLVMETASPQGGSIADTVGVLQFELDDMTPEELATALDRLRLNTDVLDASYQLRFGKKGRPQFAVQVLSRPQATDAVAALCLIETSTLGVRLATQARRVLRREAGQVVVDGQAYPDKRAVRPDGSVTSKLEADALHPIAGLAARRRVAGAVQVSPDLQDTPVAHTSAAAQAGGSDER